MLTLLLVQIPKNKTAGSVLAAKPGRELDMVSDNNQDDKCIKAEIDSIGKRIDKIIETVEKFYPLSN